MTDEKTKFEEQIKQGKLVLEKLDNKDFSLYFFTLDTKGNPTAGIANIYEHVKVLNKLGYKAFILHEKNDYKLKGDENGTSVCEWLGEEYTYKNLYILLDLDDCTEIYDLLNNKKLKLC